MSYALRSLAMYIEAGAETATLTATDIIVAGLSTGLYTFATPADVFHRRFMRDMSRAGRGTDSVLAAGHLAAELEVRCSAVGALTTKEELQSLARSIWTMLTNLGEDRLYARQWEQAMIDAVYRRAVTLYGRIDWVEELR